MVLGANGSVKRYIAYGHYVNGETKRYVERSHLLHSNRQGFQIAMSRIFRLIDVSWLEVESTIWDLQPPFGFEAMTYNYKSVCAPVRLLPSFAPEDTP